MTTTPNMGLTLPTDKGSDDVWDSVLDTVFGLIDSHSHTTGQGVPIVSAALRINADVSASFSGTSYAFTNLKAIDFAAVAVSAVAGYAGALFINSADNELYYRTIAGTNVKFTSGASLNVAGFVGGIGGDYSAVGALESYDDATDRYLFQQQGGPRPWAGLAGGNIDIYQQAPSIVNRVRLQSPNSLAASYTWTFPAALPATTQALTIDTGGAVALGAGFTLNANQGIAISGTATYKHGVKTKRAPVFSALCSTASAITQSAGTQGIVLPNNATVFVPVPQVAMHERWTGVEIWFTSIANAVACTCELFTSSTASPDTGAMTTLSTFLTPGGTSISSTLITIAPANAQSLWIKVTNSATTPGIAAVGCSYDVP